MPAILRYKGYKFFFYSNEGIPKEHLHVHVLKDERVAKFWLEPTVSLAESYKMKPHELNELQKVVEKNVKMIKRAWYEYFND
jgi:hypothetical protein